MLGHEKTTEGAKDPEDGSRGPRADQKRVNRVLASEPPSPEITYTTANARLPKNRSIIGPAASRHHMLNARCRSPTWRNIEVKRRQYSWSTATKGPKFAPQSISASILGSRGETPLTIIARKTSTQTAASIGVTKTRRVAVSQRGLKVGHARELTSESARTAVWGPARRTSGDSPLESRRAVCHRDAQRDTLGRAMMQDSPERYARPVSFLHREPR